MLKFEALISTSGRKAKFHQKGWGNGNHIANNKV